MIRCAEQKKKIRKEKTERRREGATRRDTSALNKLIFLFLLSARIYREGTFFIYNIYHLFKDVDAYDAALTILKREEVVC